VFFVARRREDYVWFNRLPPPTGVDGFYYWARWFDGALTRSNVELREVVREISKSRRLVATERQCEPTDERLRFIGRLEKRLESYGKRGQMHVGRSCSPPRP